MNEGIRFFKVGLLALLVCVSLWAQSTAGVNGVVKDTSGSAVPGAEVKATNSGTGAARTVTTNADGSFVITNLPIGPYQIEVSKEGFAKAVQAGVVLEVNSNPTLDIALKVGTVSEQVVVEASAAQIETQTTGVGQVIDNTRVLQLPLNARDSQQLIILAGGAVGGGIQNSNRTYPVSLISVGGGQSDALTYILDGGTHNEPYVDGPMPLPFPDALQEFKVELSSVPAQYGQHYGGAVTAVTKSGTNDFHGTLFEFLRNKVLNSRNAFATQRDGLKRNQFGGVVGGRIIRDKLFFFFGDQGTITRAVPTQVNAFVPTANMLAGNWTDIASAACNGGTAKTLKGGFTNNTISPALFSTPAVNLLKESIWPKTTNPCGLISFGRANNYDEQSIIGRGDYQINDKSSFFARYMVARRNELSDYDGSDILSLSAPAYKRRAHSLTLGYTYLISNTVVSSFRATGLRTVNDKNMPDYFNWADLGVQNVTYPGNYAKIALATVTGYFTLIGPPATPGHANATSIQLTEDINMSRGAHSLAFGVNLINGGVNYLTGTNAPGTFTFSNTNTGLAIGDFMLGKANRWTQSQLSPWYVRQYYLAFYAQDAWKVTPRLTVMAGLRYEPYLAPYTKYVQSGVFSYAWFNQLSTSTVFKNAPAGLLFGDDPQLGLGNKLNNNRWSGLAPRLGLSWDPTGNGKMVIRASAGLFYDYAHLDTYRNLLASPPTGGQAALSGVDFANPWAGYAGGSPFPLSFGPNTTFLPAAVYLSVPQGLKRPYYEQWNVSVQRQFGTAWLATASYLGNLGIHGTMGHEGNVGVFLPAASCVLAGVTYTPCSTVANLNARRQLSLINPTQGAYYSQLALIDSTGTHSYNGMITSLQRRATKGITVLANYTWSHCIDTGASTGTNDIQRWDPTQNRNDRGNCELDRRHNFNLSAVYQAPQLKGGWTQTLASNWQVSLISRALSGAWLTVVSGVDNAMTGTTDQYPNISGSPYALNKGVASGVWLNTAAFSQPATGTYGNMSAHSIQGPGSITFDMALARVFKIRENISFMLRAETFNIANHVNPGNPFADVPSGVDLTETSPTFGKILNAADPRIMQVAAKFSF